MEKGFHLTVAYAGIPDCIAASNSYKSTAAKNKTRYKGKMWNTSPPADYALWEEICYEYTKHNVERYGLDVVKEWNCHCFNEPDTRMFFMSNLDKSAESLHLRCVEYCKLYAAFQRGVRRVSDEIRIGGPALAEHVEFLGEFLDFVRENDMKLDFITAHYYGTTPARLNAKADRILVDSLVKKQKDYERVLKEHGFSKTPLVIDEWGMATGGFENRENCPDLMIRETEIFSAYFAKLIYRYIEESINIEGLMICLSGQHEMVEDFSGFRNFFTLNFIKKPIYNAYILSGKLGEGLLSAKSDSKNVFCVPTRREDGSLSVLVSYSSEYFEENIPAISEALCFEESIVGKRVTVWCIDKTHTNPYRLYQKMGLETPNEEDLRALRAEGIMKPFSEFIATEEAITLPLTANATFLVTVE
ncbi:MAG: hypothetical protein IJY22_08460 [Clostridia bacterium]|nr:hypothetical protein [Clostridia bacterium]